MDYSTQSREALQALARERGIGADGAPGRTSWVAIAARATLTAALEASDKGQPLALPLESVKAGPTAQADAAALLAQAVALLAGQGGKLDEPRVRDIAAEEARKALAPKTLVLHEASGERVEVGRTHEAFDRVLEVLDKGLIPYLIGPPGVGKSHMGRQLAAALAPKVKAESGAESYAFEADSFNEGMQDWRVSGFKSVTTGEFIASPFYRCCTLPGLYLGDEIDKALANVVGTFSLALDNTHASFACGLVRKHEWFRCMFAGNTVGLGATPQFPDRSRLPDDFRDRVVYIHVGVDMKLEREIALAFNPKADNWVDRVQAVRERVNAAALPLSITPRASSQGARLLALGWALADVERACLWRHAPDAIVRRANGEA
jgi:MoxR-like ATPase